jgi:hypothetical protein
VRDHGYSGTPLVRKLGLKPGMRVLLLDAPANYWTLVGGTPDALGVLEVRATSREAVDFTHLFATSPSALKRHLSVARRRMAQNGFVWASWPKRSAGTATGIGRDDVMRAGKDAGLVDVKVCAVDGTWSGLKFVIPRAARSADPRIGRS